MRHSRLVELDGGPMTSFGVRLATGALVVGVVVLMLGVGYHLMTIPPPSAEEQRVAYRQEQLEVQAHQQALDLERSNALADQRLDASWRPWRAAAVNVLVMSLTLAPVAGLGLGGVLLWRHVRPAVPGRTTRASRGPRLPSTRSWLRSRSWWSRPTTSTPLPWGSRPPPLGPPSGGPA
jgi:hypothetical protein